MRILTDTEIAAARRQLIGLPGAEERWAALAAFGADDQQMIDRLTYEIGFGSGTFAEAHIYLTAANAGCERLISIGGDDLISVARSIFGINPPGQLGLFAPADMDSEKT